MNDRPVTRNAPTNGDERMLSCMRQIQTDAEKICSDAADIEDARFLAENIADTCRRFLANGNGAGSSAFPVDCAQADREKLDVLSARELEIFTHLAEGRSAAQIAVKLSRSSKTINNHRTRILQKLGLKNAADLVRLALRSGLVSV
jgi:DNA-binding CsgD family transcriptional regulator